MKYEIIKPPEVLQKFVRYFSILDYYNNSDTPNQIKVFTDRYPHLVFQHCSGDSAFSVNGNKLPLTFLSGIKISPYNCDIHYKHSAITVTFYPQAIKQLFGIDVHELNNELVDIYNFSPGQLNDHLLHAKSNAKKIEILVDFLVKKIQPHKNEDLFIGPVLRKVNNIKNEQSIPELLKHFSISERKLERMFKDCIGLTPKFYLRATRFERSLNLMRSNAFENLSDIAYALNFTDQSHFIKDFKEFSGMTPKAYLNKNTALENNAPTLNPADGLITINHEITY